MSGCFVGLFMGLYVGWTSPMVTIFSSKEETPLPSGPMTQTEISLMSSLLYIGAIIGAFLSGWLANRIGRKWGIFISMVPQIFANVLIIVAEEPILLLLARTVNGFVVGVANVVLPIFLSEISEDSLKTTIGLFSGIIFNIGIFLGKFLTGFFGIYAVPIFTFPLTVIFIGAFFICPDTPEYLLLRNRLQDAEKSLKFYRGIPKYQPMPETCAMEFEEMKAVVNIKGRGSQVTIEDFKQGATILAVIISAVLTSTMNFTGVRITTSFTEALLIDSGIPMDTSLVDMAISSMQLIGTLSSIYIMRKIGVRKSILIYYTLGAVALIGASIHYYLHDLGLDLYPAMWSFLTFLAISVVIPSTGLNNLSYIN
ncbi:facilitated trehalose transporter Tret1-like [Lutzomyia longipalpis]|uniref:facilitated trehalose transporter Tret1-like n=1 Tax=Lutzomyia longipalpis TaxID=7200 RepID=UPI002483B754|nr:facilitated trehalose transporter Tret1-like [Lutzomyia longipalpis]